MVCSSKRSLSQPKQDGSYKQTIQATNVSRRNYTKSTKLNRTLSEKQGENKTLMCLGSMHSPSHDVLLSIYLTRRAHHAHACMSGQAPPLAQSRHPKPCHRSTLPPKTATAPQILHQTTSAPQELWPNRRTSRPPFDPPHPPWAVNQLNPPLSAHGPEGHPP